MRLGGMDISQQIQKGMQIVGANAGWNSCCDVGGHSTNIL
jgi:hypothetical protein